MNESPGGTLDVLSIDPATGDTVVMRSPVASEFGAWGMTVGPDGNVYLGTLPTGHFMMVNTQTQTLVDLGRPSSTETYIWTVTFGSDGNLYGVTYPNCKLVRYEPATGALADLGRLDPVQQYARSLVATANGYLYAGVGPDAANIAAYQIGTGQVTGLLPAADQLAAFPAVSLGADGNGYATVNSLAFKLSQDTATPIAASLVVGGAPHNELTGGRFVTLATSLGASGSYVLTMTVTNPVKTIQLSYAGDPIRVFRLGSGPDNTVYGSTIVPADLFEVNTSQPTLDLVGSVGTGEVYSFLSLGNNLEMAAYYGFSSLMSYTPGSPVKTTGSSPNTTLQTYSTADVSWRPEALIEGPDGHVYAGAQAGYGTMNGPLVEWNTTADTAQVDTLAPNQSIVSLASWENLVLGGTSIDAGQSTQKNATLIAWDTAAHQVDWTVTPVAGATSITDLVSAPNGLVYGIANATLFEFNPAKQTVTRTEPLPFPVNGSSLYNSASVDEAGRIWGLSPSGIFVIDTTTLYAYLIAPSPVNITAGWAMSDGDIYFASGNSVYGYTIPTAAGTIGITPAQTTFNANLSLSVRVSVTGSGSTPTGTVILTAGSYTSPATALSGGSSTFTVPAGSYHPGAGTISVFYSGDQNNLYSTATTAVTSVVATPVVTITPAATTLVAGSTLRVVVGVAGSGGTPTGTVTLTAGSYTTQATLSGIGQAIFTIPALSLPVGSGSISVAYSGDANFASVAASTAVTENSAAPTVTVKAAVSTMPVGSTLGVNVAVAGAAGAATGTATLTAGSYTAQATLSSGGAAFTIPAGKLSLGSNTISVSYGGNSYYAAAVGSTVAIENKATPTLTVSPATVSSSVGSAVTFAVHVTGNAATPTGTVILWGTGYSSTTVTLSGGVASFTIPAGSLPVGSVTLTASYSGDANYFTGNGTSVLTETKATPTVTVTPAASSVAQGASLYVTVALSGHAATPTGTATLKAGSYTSAAVTLSGGWAAFTVPANSFQVGSGSISVAYGGDSTYAAATASAAVTVTLATPAVTVTPAATRLVAGSTLRVVAGVAGTGGVPTGTVTLKTGSYTTQAILSGIGQAIFTIPALSMPVGSNSISVAYSGDTNFASTSGSAAVTETSAASTVTVTAAAGTVALGSTVGVNVAVAGTVGAATGTATLTAGSYTAQATLSSGAAAFTIPVSKLSLGSNTISVSYGGNSFYAASGGSTAATVIKATPTIKVSPAVVSSSVGSSLTFTVSVTGNAAAPTGTVILWGTGYSSTTVTLSGGLASFTIPAGSLPVGTVTLTASYSGDANYLTGNGTAALTETKATPSVKVTPAASSVASGTSLYVTVAVSGTASSPTGTATLTAGSYTSSAVTLSGGWASFTVPAGSLTAGTDNLKVSYSGAASYLTGTGTAAVTVVQ